MLCVHCDQSFSTKEEFLFHLECHNAIKPYFCTECDQRYAYKSTLERHEAVHVREKILDEQQKPKDSKICVDKNYSCVKCDYTCDSKQKLNTHNIAHSSKNCFTCKNCNFKTDKKFPFSRHQGECVPS